MNDIVFTIEFDDDSANSRANEYLSQGWTLLHVGQKLIDILENEQAYYNTTYVLGANQAQYDKYKEEQKQANILDEFA
ncbi:hypothetical protein [Leuconostoc mesenteroides]|uniref:hypothetical protein n=1 Tax=Leuconostoc mesenteroides TaxID=1245 RepID=UPI001CBA8AD8|nr:hypothetical protein [Leuconostoc mesenteroides]